MQQATGEGDVAAAAAATATVLKHKKNFRNSFYLSLPT
jgi:hypothetical protein